MFQYGPASAPAAKRYVMLKEERNRNVKVQRTGTRTYATLCIYPGKVPPEEITNKLRIAPSRMTKKGDIIGTSGRRLKLNGWFLSTQGIIRSRDCRKHIDWIIGNILQSAPALQRLQAKGMKMHLFCFWTQEDFNGTFTMGPAQMRPLAKMNLNVIWDVYCPTSTDSA